LDLVAASKPGPDLLTKAATRIKKARKKQRVDVDMDKSGILTVNSDDEDEDIDDLCIKDA